MLRKQELDGCYLVRKWVDGAGGQSLRRWAVGRGRRRSGLMIRYIGDEAERVFFRPTEALLKQTQSFPLRCGTVQTC